MFLADFDARNSHWPKHSPFHSVSSFFPVHALARLRALALLFFPCLRDSGSVLVRGENEKKAKIVYEASHSATPSRIISSSTWRCWFGSSSRSSQSGARTRESSQEISCCPTAPTTKSRSRREKKKKQPLATKGERTRGIKMYLMIKVLHISRFLFSVF